MRGQICRLLRKIPLTPASPRSTTISPLLFSHLILPLISQCILPPNSKSSPQGSQMCWPYGYKAAICITTGTTWNNLIFTILLLFFPVWKITHISSLGPVLFKAVSSSLIPSSTFQGWGAMYADTDNSHPHTRMHYCFAAILPFSPKAIITCGREVPR